MPVKAERVHQHHTNEAGEKAARSNRKQSPLCFNANIMNREGGTFFTVYTSDVSTHHILHLPYVRRMLAELNTLICTKCSGSRPRRPTYLTK